MLINKAGVYGGNHQKFGDMDYAQWRHTVEVNTIAPFKMAESFANHLSRSQKKCLISITSQLGSTEDNTSGSYYAYRSSKAALNMVSKSLSVDLKPLGLTVVVLHPGWVKTDMGGANAPTLPQESVTGMCRVIDGLTPADSGKFLSYTGEELPW